MYPMYRAHINSTTASASKFRFVLLILPLVARLNFNLVSLFFKVSNFKHKETIFIWTVKRTAVKSLVEKEYKCRRNNVLNLIYFGKLAIAPNDRKCLWTLKDQRYPIYIQIEPRLPMLTLLLVFLIIEIFVKNRKLKFSKTRNVDLWGRNREKFEKKIWKNSAAICRSKVFKEFLSTVKEKEKKIVIEI